MINAIILDSMLLGEIVHPRRNQAVKEWLRQILGLNIDVILSEIADYELRRELLHRNFSHSIERLDQLKEVLTYLPLTTQVMLKAAELWAEARKGGRPTADAKALDGDVILAAQALQVGAIVATENVGHLSLFVEARSWKEISPTSLMQ